MNNMLAVIVASMFALGSVAGHAAEGNKATAAPAPATTVTAPAKTDAKADVKTDAKATDKSVKPGAKKDKVSRNHTKKARRAA